jgi:hypothetical protein
MGPKTPVPEEDFFRQPLREQINLKHPLVRLADLIDWDRLNTAMSASFVSQRGRPATSPRLIAGLLYLQHAFDLSDEDVVWQWLENPYWQVFTGETYLQTRPPDASSLTRWRKRLGKAGIEELLAETIEAAKRANAIKTSSLKRVIVDTTVMEKAIAHPTDSRLLERCREHLVKAAARHRLKLRQNTNREALRLASQVGRYAHAKQYKRMNKALRTLRSRVGRVMRDVERQLDGLAQQSRAALEISCLPRLRHDMTRCLLHLLGRALWVHDEPMRTLDPAPQRIQRMTDGVSQPSPHSGQVSATRTQSQLRWWVRCLRTHAKNRAVVVLIPSRRAKQRHRIAPLVFPDRLTGMGRRIRI